MKNISEVSDILIDEMKKLSFVQLKDFAENMGVDTIGMHLAQIEDACLALEQYVFTH